MNLNQIAHRLNSDEPVAAGELAEALREATGALRRLAGREEAPGEAAVS